MPTSWSWPSRVAWLTPCLPLFWKLNYKLLPFVGAVFRHIFSFWSPTGKGFWSCILVWEFPSTSRLWWKCARTYRGQKSSQEARQWYWRTKLTWFCLSELPKSRFRGFQILWLLGPYVHLKPQKLCFHFDCYLNCLDLKSASSSLTFCMGSFASYCRDLKQIPV